MNFNVANEVRIFSNIAFVAKRIFIEIFCDLKKDVNFNCTRMNEKRMGIIARNEYKNMDTDI